MNIIIVRRYTKAHTAPIVSGLPQALVLQNDYDEIYLRPPTFQPV